MKVCILAAGRGERMGAFSDIIHKGLLPLGNKAIITHIIEHFSVDDEFVIALGDRGDQVKDYLQVAHPDLNITFITVDNYDGPGSGPGLSLYACREALQAPFLFTACDTLMTTELPSCDKNWMGVKQVSDIEKWCSVKACDNRITDIIYKEPADTDLAFIGVAYVHDYEAFWTGLTENKKEMGGELQVNNGLLALMAQGVFTEFIGWEDTGNETTYKRMLSQYEKNYTFEGKTTDVTYKMGERIIKFFPDYDVSARRFKRAQEYKGVFADVLVNQGGFYSYVYQSGELISHCMSQEQCKNVLQWADTHLWRDVSVDQDKFRKTNKQFYFDKTLKRLNAYIEQYLPAGKENAVRINDLMCKPVQELLNDISEEVYCAGHPSTYHGDFHTDNILVTEKGYCLIDWRDCFGDCIEVGDRYYDLAKFLHTLELSVRVMEKNLYRLELEGDCVTISHEFDAGALKAIDAFWAFVEENNYDAYRIEIINALIYINMAPLYNKDMADYLYYLGRFNLQKTLNKKK